MIQFQRFQEEEIVEWDEKELNYSFDKQREKPLINLKDPWIRTISAYPDEPLKYNASNPTRKIMAVYRIKDSDNEASLRLDQKDAICQEELGMNYGSYLNRTWTIQHTGQELEVQRMLKILKPALLESKYWLDWKDLNAKIWESLRQRQKKEERV